MSEKKMQSKLKLFATEHRSEVMMASVLIIMLVALSFISPVFLTVRNVTNILSQIGFIAILSLGQTFVMLTGGIDLSVGSVLGISSMVGVIVMKSTGSVTLGIMVMLLVGLVVGLVNGVLVAKFDIPAFVVTLGMMQACRSGDYLISGGHAVNKLPEAYRALASGEIFTGFRVYYVFIIILYVIIHWVLSNTKLGRNTYAIGSNAAAARLAGINTSLYRMLPYIISGILAAVSGIIMAARFGAVDPNYGTDYEMSTLAAVVIGGTAMTGGKGTILGTAIGVIFMGVLSNGLDITGVSPYWQGVATGIVLILALLIERLSSKKI